jgi:hypothetical protein
MYYYFWIQTGWFIFTNVFHYYTHFHFTFVKFLRVCIFIAKYRRKTWLKCILFNSTITRICWLCRKFFAPTHAACDMHHEVKNIDDRKTIFEQKAISDKFYYVYLNVLTASLTKYTVPRPCGHHWTCNLFLVSSKFDEPSKLKFDLW